MLLAELKKILGMDDNAREVISCGLNREFVNEHSRGGRGVAELAGERVASPINSRARGRSPDSHSASAR